MLTKLCGELLNKLAWSKKPSIISVDSAEVVSCPGSTIAGVGITLMNPHQKVLIHFLVRVEKFGLRMSCKQRRSDYESLLAWDNLPSLKAHRSIVKLCYLNKMLHNVMHSPIPPPKPRIMDSRLWSFQDQCSSNLLQGLTFISILFILPQLPYGIINLPGCVTVLIYMHLRIICVFFLLMFSCSFICPCIICCSSLLGLPSNSFWLLSVPCSFLLNSYKEEKTLYHSSGNFRL